MIPAKFIDGLSVAGGITPAMKDHMEFFNTHQFLVNFIVGIVISMEESKKETF